jgi:hypothetical protein
LNSHRAELPDNARLVTQLCQLERHAGSAKDNVKHPPGGHDDVANAVAGAIVLALQVAATEVTSFPIPFVAGTPRNIPGQDIGVGASERASFAAPSAPAASYDYNKETSWRSYVNPDGSIRSTPRGRWDA